MHLQARKPILAFLLALLLIALAACTALSFPVLPEAQENTQDETPTPPSATVELGPETQHLSPELWGLLYRQADGTTVPDRVSVMILGTEAETTQSLSDYITVAGGTSQGDRLWEVPSSLLQSLVLRSDVSSMWLQTTRTAGHVSTDPYPALGLDDTLDDVVEANAAGVPSEQAALYAFLAKDGQILVDVTSPDTATETAIRTWLTARNIFLHPQTQSGARDTLYIMVVLPVGQILPLAQAFPSARLKAEALLSPGITLSRLHWHADVAAAEIDAVDWWVTPLESDGPTGTSDTPGPPETPHGCPDSPLGGVTYWKTDLAERQTLHGVGPWHTVGIDGEGVKVGIIDWGFYGFDAVPGLCNLRTTTDSTTVGTHNAFCQDVQQSIWPSSLLIRGSICQPSVMWIDPMDHGTNIAELIVDMAPGVELFMAQANSPRQVKVAADWLVAQGVDVIVHAGGWLYDGKGDGTSPLTEANSPPASQNQGPHSPYRYHPSPINTVDEITRGTAETPRVPPLVGAVPEPDNGPVWINAAGNQEHLTMYTRDVELLTMGTYKGFMIFDPDAGDDRRKACQPIVQTRMHTYANSLRWGDTWPTATHDIDFIIAPESRAPIGIDTVLYPPFLSTAIATQGDRAHAVRRGSYANPAGIDACLYIVVNEKAGVRTAPEWVQFQTLVGGNTGFQVRPRWLKDELLGRSIVNPSDSSNPGLMAIGARNLRWEDTLTVPSLIDLTILKTYSSHGPVFEATNDTRSLTEATSTVDRIKPDAVGGSGSITYRKWDSECSRNAVCSELYFGGTSSGTAHAGGLAALTVDWLKTLGADYAPGDVAALLEGNATLFGGVVNNGWGHGTLKMPDCAPTPITALPYFEAVSLAVDDCQSQRNQIRRRADPVYADYFTFSLARPATLQIDLVQSAVAGATDEVDPYLYLESGAYGSGSIDFLFQNDDGGVSYNSRIITNELAAGTYTIEATSYTTSDVGPYNITVIELCDAVCSLEVPLTVPVPAGRTPGCAAGRTPGCAAGRAPGCAAGRTPGCTPGCAASRNRQPVSAAIHGHHCCGRGLA